MSTARIRKMITHATEQAFDSMPDFVLIAFLSKLNGETLSKVSITSRKMYAFVRDNIYFILIPRLSRNKALLARWLIEDRFAIQLLLVFNSRGIDDMSIRRAQALCENRKMITSLDPFKVNEFHAEFENLIEYALRMKPRGNNLSLGLALLNAFVIPLYAESKAEIFLSVMLASCLFGVALYHTVKRERNHANYRSSLFTLFESAEHRLTRSSTKLGQVLSNRSKI